MYNKRDGDLSPTLVINNNMAKKVTKVTTEAQRICKELGVNRLFYNTKGEYFTNHSYAVASEGGDKKKVSTYMYDADEEEKAPEKEVKASVKADKKDVKAEKEAVKVEKEAVDAGNATEKTEGDE